MLTGGVMKRLFGLALALITLFSSTPSRAYGLRTHLWIAQQIINDLQRDCEVTVGGVGVVIPERVCLAIRRAPQAFLAGSLGPDAYPDLITGQVTAHPGIPGDWRTSNWIAHMLRSASSEQEAAFSAGYAVHAASDTFAHSYVNAYAGDIFSLGDERAVELRHFILEKYIDHRLPVGGPDPMSMRVPADYLRDQLVYNRDAARNAGRSGIALHIPAMNVVWETVNELEDKAEALEDVAADALSTILATYADLTARLATGDAQLVIARENFRLHEQRLALQKAALDEAKRVLDAAIDAARRNQELILQSERRAQLARAAIREAESALNTANNLYSDLQRNLVGLQHEIADIPRRIMDRVCSEYCNDCEWWDVGCHVVCNTVCRLVEIANPVWERLNDQIAGVRRRIIDTEQNIRNQTARIAARTAEVAVALQAKLEAEALSAALNIAQATAQAVYDPIKAAFDAEEALFRTARELVERLRQEIESLREQIVNATNIREAIRELIDRSNIISGYFNNWRNGLERAGSAYIETALVASQRLATDQGGAMSAYLEWVRCHGSAYTPVPYQVGEFSCQVEEFYDNAKREVDALIERILPEPVARLYRDYTDLKSLLKERLKDELETAALAFARLIAPDGSTADLIDVMARPENATPGRLNQVFGEVGDANGKALLTFENMAAGVDRDLGLTNGRLDPRRFAPLAHPLTMSKLALLDQPELRRLTWRLGGNPAELQLGQDHPRYTILQDTLRSIDGNHQWQPFGLPYARSDGEEQPVNPDERHFGYGPGDGAEPGFPFFVNPRLRATVFSRLFPNGISGQASSRPELQWPIYPFPECRANPFPLAFNPDGSAAASDDRCARPGANNPPGRPRDGLRRFWRSVLDFLGLEPRSVRAVPPQRQR